MDPLVVPVSHGLKWDCPVLPDSEDRVPGSDPPGVRSVDCVLPSSAPSLEPGPHGPLLCGQRVALPSVGACCDLSVLLPLWGLPGVLLGLGDLLGSVVLGLTGLGLMGLLWQLLLLLLSLMSVRKVGKGSFDGVVSIWLACLRTKPGIRHFSIRTNPFYYFFLLKVVIVKTIGFS